MKFLKNQFDIGFSYVDIVFLAYFVLLDPPASPISTHLPHRRELRCPLVVYDIVARVKAAAHVLEAGHVAPPCSPGATVDQFFM